MYKSERKSLIRFLLIYLGSTFLLFGLALSGFYHYQKHQLLDQQMQNLRDKAEQVKSQLRILHDSYDTTLMYPKYESFDSSIYDLNKRYIFGTFKNELDLDKIKKSDQEDTFYYISRIEPYYLGAAYILVVKPVNHTPIVKLGKSIILFMLAAGMFFSLIGIFLGKLFIAPMRESIAKMNHFIQDATHELNTPISTILTNIELLETFGKCTKNEELKRIEIASKTLSRIYDDLIYLNLNHSYYRNIQDTNFSELLYERFLYFKIMAEAKHLRFDIKIDPDIKLLIDNSDAVRVIDNLLNNAIKYNNPNGLLSIELTNKYLRIKDTGIGIAKENLQIIFHRFERANSSEGGFGIGLDIVNQVVRYYGFSLTIDSKLHQGTEVEIQWSKQ